MWSGAREKLGRERVSGTISRLTPRDHTYTYKLETHAAELLQEGHTGHDQYGETRALRPQRGERFLGVRWEDGVGWVRGTDLKGLHGDPMVVSLALLNGTSNVQAASAGKAQCRSK